MKLKFSWIIGIFIPICLCITLLSSIIGCEQAPKIHIHTFSETFEKSETHHWRIATCEHKEEISILTNNFIKDNYSKNMYDLQTIAKSLCTENTHIFTFSATFSTYVRDYIHNNINNI